MKPISSKVFQSLKFPICIAVLMVVSHSKQYAQTTPKVPLKDDLQWTPNHQRVKFVKAFYFPNKTKDELMLNAVKWANGVFKNANPKLGFTIVNPNEDLKSIMVNYDLGLIACQKIGLTTDMASDRISFTASVNLIVTNGSIVFEIENILLSGYRRDFIQPLEELLVQEKPNSKAMERCVELIIHHKNAWLKQFSNYMND
jgi:hypothetical protein